MSRRPGVGAGWIKRFKSDVFPSDEVIVSGRPLRPPRFYESVLSDEELSDVKARRVGWLSAHPDRQGADYLEAVEANLKARLGERPI